DVRNDGRSHCQPLKCAGSAIFFKFRKNRAQFLLGDDTLSVFPVKCRCGLRLPENTASHVIGRSEFADGVPSRIPRVQPDNVTCMDVEHQSASSRSSEIAVVLSVPFPTLPLSSNLANARERLRCAKYGTSAGRLSGTSLAIVRPLSVTRICPCCAASRTQRPVRACSS